MSAEGWPTLLSGWPWFREPGAFPLAEYAESMPPPWMARKPYGEPILPTLTADDPFGWPVSAYEETLEIRPGLERVARPLIRAVAQLAAGEADAPLAALLHNDNPYWPPELATAGALEHERYVVLFPLALSRTQDEDGHVRWTLFGNSEQGPARPFWRSAFLAPNRERPPEETADFLSRLLHKTYGEEEGTFRDLHRIGLRVFPSDDAREGPLPAWVESLRWHSGRPLRGVRYLLTFRPFATLPVAVRSAYLAGRLHLLPCPGSLVFWGFSDFFRLQLGLPLAGQIPFQLLLPAHDAEGGLRIPKAGWSEEPAPGEPPTEEAATHSRRWPHRSPEPEGWAGGRENRLAHVLFGTAPDDIQLYNKPLACNAQLWTADFRSLLDGPRASRSDLRLASHAFAAGGRFGYRFLSPAMRVGRHELYWHRPLVAYRTPGGHVHVLTEAPTGYLTAYPANRPDPAAPAIELWPRPLDQGLHAEAVRLLKDAAEDEPRRTLRNVRNLLEARDRLKWERLPHEFARRLIAAPKEQSLEAWLKQLPAAAIDSEGGTRLVEKLLGLIDPPLPTAEVPPSLTYTLTARRSFEVQFWKAIAWLSTGRFPNRSTADPILDGRTIAARGQPPRDLDALADALMKRHRAAIAKAGMQGKAVVGDIPFRWETKFDYPWMGGWAASQTGPPRERNVVVMIPGRDRSQAVVLADHYDTAYRADRYEERLGGDKVHVSAPGADDNGSATAALVLAAPALLELSRQGRLHCDIWLVHLTGEEFPADGTGARNLCQRLIEGGLYLRLSERNLDLSDVRVRGLYVMDMIAHNRRADRDVFQISPGAGPRALWLAYQAHLANAAWNAGTVQWNRRPDRRTATRSKRSSNPDAIPAAARDLALFGEVRPNDDPRSTFYNADGQEFSDSGIPAVLLMENYDISREGYHDSKDTLERIDLDYGAALAAIAIESAARAATETPPAAS